MEKALYFPHPPSSTSLGKGDSEELDMGAAGLA